MSHTLRNDVLVAHGLMSRDQSMTNHALDERHLLYISVDASLSCLHMASGLVEHRTHELDIAHQ